jgi:hypothetical protein
MTLSIAGISTRFILPKPFALRLAKSYAPFLRQTAKPHAAIIVEIMTTRGKAGKRARVSDTVDHLHFERGDMRFAYDYEENRGCLCIVPDRFVFNAFLRLFYASLLPRMNGLILHASAIAKGTQAWAFAGVSGSGKTTAARLLSTETVLADELCAIRKTAKGLCLFGTPFWGEYKGNGRNRGFRLASVYFLKKGSVTQVRMLAKDEAMKRLLRCVLWFDSGHDAVMRLWVVVEKLTGQMTLQELTFQKNSRLLKTVVFQAPKALGSFKKSR